MARLGRADWRTVLQRWCQLEDTPEVSFICWFLADCIANEPGDALSGNREPYRGGFWSYGFAAWCSAVRLNPQFVLEQINKCNAAPDELSRLRAGPGFVHKSGRQHAAPV